MTGLRVAIGGEAGTVTRMPRAMEHRDYALMATSTTCCTVPQNQWGTLLGQCGWPTM